MPSAIIRKRARILFKTRMVQLVKYAVAARVSAVPLKRYYKTTKSSCDNGDTAMRNHNKHYRRTMRHAIYGYIFLVAIGLLFYFT